MSHSASRIMLFFVACLTVSARGAMFASDAAHRQLGQPAASVDSHSDGHAATHSAMNASPGDSHGHGGGHEVHGHGHAAHDAGHANQDLSDVGPQYMPGGAGGNQGGNDHGDHDGHGADHSGHDEHAGHGGGDHSGFGDGHSHHGPLNQCSVGLAWMLFATVAWVVSLFYFINWPDEDIRKATWSTLNSMIAIFCAVLLFSASTRTIQDFAGGGFGKHHYGPPPSSHLVVAYSRFTVLFVMLQGILHYFKNDPWKFKYFASVGCHVVGFSAIDAFGETMHLKFFASQLWMSCMGVFLAWVFLTVIFTFAAKLRDKVKGTHAWKEQCEEAEADAVALALGLLTSMLIRYAIVGHLPPVHGEPKGKTDLQVWEIFISALMVAPCVVLASVLKHYMEQHNLKLEESGLQPRFGNAVMEFVETFQVTLRMTMGWTLLFWGYWSFYNRAVDDGKYGGKLGGRILMAVVFSVIVFAAIALIDKIADLCRNSTSDLSSAIEDALRALLVTFALLMGLSWEATFAEAVNAVSMEYPGPARMYVVVSLSLTLCAIVLPAWALYILPNALDKDFAVEFLQTHHEEHEEGGHKDLENLKGEKTQKPMT